jgi:hypothetical protein
MGVHCGPDLSLRSEESKGYLTQTLHPSIQHCIYAMFLRLIMTNPCSLFVFVESLKIQLSWE